MHVRDRTQVVGAPSYRQQAQRLAARLRSQPGTPATRVRRKMADSTLWQPHPQHACHCQCQAIWCAGTMSVPSGIWSPGVLPTVMWPSTWNAGGGLGGVCAGDGAGAIPVAPGGAHALVAAELRGPRRCGGGGVGGELCGCLLVRPRLSETSRGTRRSRQRRAAGSAACQERMSSWCTAASRGSHMGSVPVAY
jgi:hypothetical protein